jgi:YVTN family beta-propeller protein
VPFAVAVNPTTNRIYVANRGSDSVTVVNGSTNAEAARFPSDKVSGVAVMHRAGEATATVYVSDEGGTVTAFFD